MPVDGDEIRRRLDDGDLDIDPLDDEQIGAASVDLRLGDTFEILDSDGGLLSIFGQTARSFTRSGDSLWLAPGEFAIAETQESISLPDDLGAETKVDMNFGPPGLHVQNSGWIDPDTDGKLQIELVNNSPRPIRIDAGEPVVKLIFEDLQPTSDEETVDVVEPELELEAEAEPAAEAVEPEPELDE